MPGLRPPKEDLIPQLPIETEQKVLKATVVLTILGTLFLIIALATDYWLILSVIGEPHVMKTGNLLLGSHSGLWRSCLDIQYANSTDTFSNCTNLFDLMEDAEKAKKQHSTIAGGPGVLLAYAKSYVAFAFVSLVFVVLALLFSGWATKNQRYVIKRIAAVMWAITAICVLISIQVLENSTETKESYTEKIEHLEAHSLNHRLFQPSFGFSWALAWVPFAVYCLATLVFLLTSKKRMGTDIDGDVIMDG